jgi:hypothetical protein
MSEEVKVAEEAKKEIKKDTRIWVDTIFSSNIEGKEDEVTIKNKIDALAKELEKIIPGGRLSVSVSSEKEKFYQFEKVFSNLIASRRIYNNQSFMRNPELAVEFAQVSNHIKQINKLIDNKRKQRKGGKK